MPTSIFLARLMGPIFLAVGIGVLANATVYRELAEEFLNSHVLVYLSGLLLMTAGMAIVLTHNLWVRDWRIIITLLGWLGVIGGALRIVVPQSAETIGRWFLAQPRGHAVAAVIWLGIGAVLTSFGYTR